MTNCDNLCTAAKCAELEARINYLERKLEEHLNQNIPQAHRWDGDFDIFLEVVEDVLTIELYIDNIGNKSENVKLPFVTKETFELHLISNINSNSLLPHTYYPEIDHNLTVYGEGNNIVLRSEIFLEGVLAVDSVNIDSNDSNLKIDGTVTGRTLLLSIADGNSSDTAEIILPFVFQNDFDNHLRDKIPQAHDYEPLINVSADIQENTLFIDVSVDDSSDVATVELPSFKPLVNVSADIQEGTLFIDVSVDDSSDVATVELPSFEPLVNVSADIQENTLFISVAVDDSEDVATVEIMNCNLDIIIDNLDNLKNTVIQQNDENEAKISSLIFQLDLRTGEIIDSVNNVLNQVNQQFSNSFTVGICEEVTTESGEQIEWGEKIYSSSQTSVTSSGISGIAQLLELINTQISSLHRDLCKAIPPSFNLKNVTPLTCLQDSEVPVSTEQFLAQDTEFNFLLGEFQGDEETFPEPNTVNLRKNIYQYLAYKLYLLQEQQINLFQLTCKPNSDTDVVSIIANDKVINRVSSTQLVLHFVTLNNYPKRAKNSSYRPVKIPGAKKPTLENSSPYSWLSDFEDFFGIQGNQYAELRFVENYAPVSGWFENPEAANNYFDKVLTLTSATESNRVIPLHSNPKTNIPVRTTRPYRAFICELNQQGQNQCLAKYQPIT